MRGPGSIPFVASALVALVSGCRSPDVTFRGELFAASVDGGTVCYVEEGRAVRLDEAGARLEVPLAGTKEEAEALEAGASSLHLLGAGERAVLFGIKGNMAFDLFGHAGRHVSAAAVIDFREGRVRSADEALPGLDVLGARKGRLRLYQAPGSPRLYAWWDHFGTRTLVVYRPEDGARAALDLGDGAERLACAVVETGAGELLVAQAPAAAYSTPPSLRILVFDASAWPPAPARRVDLPGRAYQSLRGLEVSTDGRYVAYWAEPVGSRGSMLGVFDVPRRAAVVDREERADGFIHDVELRPEHDGVLVSDWIDPPDGGGYGGRVRRFDLSGAVRRTFDLSGSAHRIFWTKDGAACWIVGYGRAWRVLLSAGRSR